MHNSMSVAMSESLKYLICETFDFFNGKPSSSVILNFLFHILFDVIIKVLKDNMKLFIFINDLFYLYNIRMFERLQQSDLSNCGTRNSIIFFLESYFLECNNLKWVISDIPHLLICFKLCKQLHMYLLQACPAFSTYQERNLLYLLFLCINYLPL